MGLVVGFVVGEAVGLVVGLTVGLVVGLTVGLTVGHTPQSSGQLEQSSSSEHFPSPQKEEGSAHVTPLHCSMDASTRFPL